MRISCVPGLRILLIAAVCACLTGCFDTKQEITLNPDGSGKVRMESTFAQTELLLTRNAQLPPVTPASDFVRKQLEEAQGVDAWKDVSFSETDDGRVTFRGTAYFQDLSKLKVGLNSFLRFSVTKDAAGQLSIGLLMDTSGTPLQSSATNTPVTAESIRLERKQFRAAQPLLAATLGAMKLETVFHFPGSLRRASNFETNTPSALRVRFDGTRLMPALEERIFDPEFARQRIARGSTSNFLNDDHFINEKLYGQRAPLLALIAPGKKAIFDYAAEVAEARQAYPLLARTLGLIVEPASQSKPAVDGAPARIKVTGVGWRFDGATSHPVSDGVRQGYTLSLMAELPGTVFNVDKIRVTRAETLEGVLLDAPGVSHHRTSLRNHFLQTNASFDLQLSSPPLNSSGLAVVSGVLECASAEELRRVELVSGKLRAGGRGAEFGAEIEYAGSHLAGGGKLVLRTTLPPEQLLSIEVVGDGGMVMELEPRGQMRVGSVTTSTWLAPRGLPRSGKLVADVLAGSRALHIPFSVTNITLLGQPLAAK